MKGIDYEILQVLCREAKKLVDDEPLSAKDVWNRLDVQMRSKYWISNIGTRLGIMAENGIIEVKETVEKRGAQSHYSVKKYSVVNPDHWLDMPFGQAKEIMFHRLGSAAKHHWASRLETHIGTVSLRFP